MIEYFEFVKSCRKPQDLVHSMRTWKFDYEASKVLRLDKIMPMHDVQWYYKNKIATCAGVAHFFIKTLNLIDKKYAAFGLCYTWPSRFSNKDGLDHGKTVDIFITKIPVYYDDQKIWYVDFRNLNMSNFSIYGPFKNLQEVDDNFYPLAKKLVYEVDPNVEVKRGVSIIDVRVADDKRIWEAVKFFGVDNYDYYYAELFKRE